MDLSKYTDNQLFAILEFIHRMKVLLGPIWIQQFLDDVNHAVNEECNRRD